MDIEDRVLTQAVAIWPNAAIGQEKDGQLVIYTGVVTPVAPKLAYTVDLPLYGNPLDDVLDALRSDVITDEPFNAVQVDEYANGDPIVSFTVFSPKALSALLADYCENDDDPASSIASLLATVRVTLP